MESKTTISFANVSANYDKGDDVLSDVSFNISGGAFYFLTGNSGAGKTTLLRLIYQLHKPSTGTIKLFGHNCETLSRDETSKLFDNVALPLRVRDVSADKIKKLVTKTLEWVGLGKYADVYPMELSGGQQQRVSVARAIITQPSILLADEPTGNLDEENASRLMELFIKMNKMFGTTVILATHNKKLLETYKFPVITVDNHHVTFSEANTEKNSTTTSTRKWKGPQPQNYFSEISKQFEDIGKI